MEILPVNAVVYNQEKIDIKDTAAPPYDVIDAEYRSRLEKRSRYNIAGLILPEGEGSEKYKTAERLYKSWLEQGILINVKKPAVFLIIQKYTNEKGRCIERKGFIARNKLEEFSSKKILPHEYTMGGPKEDRYKLISAAGAFFSQIFMVYNDEKQIIENEVMPKYLSQKPFINMTDDYGVQNIVYIIDDENDIKIIQKTLEDKTLLIADGHHRYETALKYAHEHPENEYAKYVMSYFTNSADANLIIYPTHRIIEKNISKDEMMSAVKKYYDIEELENKEDFLEKIEIENQKQITSGLVIKGDKKFYVLKLKPNAQKEINKPEVLQNLDLTVLHELILKKELKYTDDELMSQNGIKYEKRENEAFNSLNNGASAVFITAYPKMKDILKITNAGCRMPQKSTYFYPKLLSGIVINPIK